MKPSWYLNAAQGLTNEDLEEMIEYEEAQLKFAENAYRACPEEDKGYFYLDVANTKMRIAMLKDTLEERILSEDI